MLILSQRTQKTTFASRTPTAPNVEHLSKPVQLLKSHLKPHHLRNEKETHQEIKLVPHYEPERIRKTPHCLFQTQRILMEKEGRVLAWIGEETEFTESIKASVFVGKDQLSLYVGNVEEKR